MGDKTTLPLAMALFQWSTVKDWMLSACGHDLGYESMTVTAPPPLIPTKAASDG